MKAIQKRMARFGLAAVLAWFGIWTLSLLGHLF